MYVFEYHFEIHLAVNSTVPSLATEGQLKMIYFLLSLIGRGDLFSSYKDTTSFPKKKIIS